MNTLNLGCGSDTWGTHRVDMVKTPTTTHVIRLGEDKLPFEDSFFDEVRMNAVLEHILNLGQVIDELYRVCKKGAVIRLSTDHAGWIWWHTNKREHNKYLDYYYTVDGFGHQQHDDAHYHLFVASHLQKMFRKFDFVSVSYGYHAKYGSIRFLLKLLPNHWGAREIKAEITK